MASLKGTETEKNLLMAFAGESQARNRYNYFSGQAKKAVQSSPDTQNLQTATSP